MSWSKRRFVFLSTGHAAAFFPGPNLTLHQDGDRPGEGDAYDALEQLLFYRMKVVLKDVTNAIVDDPGIH
jgi:hypothetical protein